MTDIRHAQIKAQIADLKAELEALDPIGQMGVRQLARVAGISPTTATRVKRGEAPDMKTAKKLIPYLSECPCCGQKLKQ